MKRALILIILFSLTASLTDAQVISMDMVQRNRNLDVRLTLKDSRTLDPISWASVYLIPHGDTTITHFALSDEKGDVELKEVPAGKYELNAEIIGYHPHRKTYFFKNWREDLGIIKMEENAEFLEAAKITAAGNAIMVKKDTIIFNASSFKVGENDVLGDLLRKMPGIEIGNDGSVTVNGEKVDKITVGGKTFFFDDPTAALSNLPAKIVDRIKVVDKDKDAAEFSGISTKDDKEKVMDVELKDEYTRGWFGNAKAGGGATLTPDVDDALIDDRRMLYNGNAMVSGYNEKDQVVFIGNAFNATEPGSQTYTFYGLGSDNNDFAAMKGINSSAQAGANYSTERLEGFESTVSVNYRNNGKDAATRSARTSFQNGGPDLKTDENYTGYGTEDAVTASLEIQKKDKEKYMLYFEPTFKFSGNRVNTSKQSWTYSEDKELNSSSSGISSCTESFNAYGWLGGGIKNMGKERRSLTLDINYLFTVSDGTRKELSNTSSGGAESIRNLSYGNRDDHKTIGGHIAYVEPIGQKWAIQTYISSSYSSSRSGKDAFNPDGSANSYYTSASDQLYLQEEIRLLMQYKTDTLNVQFGLLGDMILNEIKARSLGSETLTGKDDWMLNWSPFASMRYKLENHNVNVYYTGYTQQQSGASTTPALDISNPIRISAGNIYLKPSFSHYINASYSMNDRETFSFLNVHLNGSIGTNSMVQASWFDESGVRYAVPVNSARPDANLSLYTSWNMPFGKNREFTVSASGWGNVITGTGYQARERLKGPDLTDFDYVSFMKDFWGNPSGDRFYSGLSGFSESSTDIYNWGVQASLKYTAEMIDAKLSGTTGNRISRYSLDPSADMDTWTSNIGCDVIFTPGNDWEIKSDIRYIFYSGFTDGFGKPEWNWNMSISKSIRSVTLALKAADILNQTKSLQRNISSEYMEDVYSAVLGRYFLFSISFNFGKMNSRKNSRVESAMWRGAW